MKGDMQAIKFCEEIAWRQEKQMGKSQISPYSLEEVLERSRREHIKHGEMMTPTFLKKRAKRLTSGNPPVAGMSYVEPPKPSAEPATEAVPVSSCDACGATRCAMCDICELCE